MSEQPETPPDADPAEASAESLRTGNAAVDRVLDSLDSLDGAPVDDHVAVFERAHEQLRSALDGEEPRPADTSDGPVDEHDPGADRGD